MASYSYTHRKLLLSLNTTTNTPTIQTCLNFCNKTLKPDTVSLKLRFCPPPCLAICPSICHYTLFPRNTTNANTPQNHNLSPLLISMLILLALTFISITFYTLHTKFYSTFHQSNTITTTTTTAEMFHPTWYFTTATVGLNSTAVDSIKAVKYENGVYESDCVVCLGEFIINDDVKFLPKCNHVFHVYCIDTWLKSHVTCPLCRAPVDIDKNGQDCDFEGSRNSIIRTGDDELRNEEVVINVNNNSNSNSNSNNNIECSEETKENNKGSCSQRWCLERGAISLVSRSLSCSGKIFSSRYTDRPVSDDS